MQTTPTPTSYGIFLDLSKAGTIYDAINLNEEAYDDLVRSLSKAKLDYEVSIKHPEGTVQHETFASFKEIYFSELPSQ